MIESLRSLLLAGLGAAVITREKVLEATQQWVDKGSVTAAEAERLADELVEESRQQAKDMGQHLQDTVESVLGRMDLARKKDLAALEERVALLEESLAALAGDRPAGPAPDQMPGSE